MISDDLIVNFNRDSNGHEPHFNQSSTNVDNCKVTIDNLDASNDSSLLRSHRLDSTVRKPKSLFGLRNKIKSPKCILNNNNNTINGINNEKEGSTIATKNLEARIDVRQVEIIQMIQRLEQTLLSTIFESQQKIINNISKLSDRVDHIEHVFSKKVIVDDNHANPAKNNVQKQNTSKVNQVVTKRKIEKREALVTSIVDLSHVVKNIPKSHKVKTLLNKQIQSNVVFQTCSEEILDDINNAFEYKSYKSGSIIIHQNSEADRFFVVEEGVLDVIQDSEHVEVLKAPASFGEISLLFGSSYHVTVCARSDCKLWFLHQQDYRTVTSQYKLKRMQFKFDFLRKVKIADKVLGEVLYPSDIDDMALATRNETFRKGDVILKEGDKGDVFYMIEEGSVDIYKKEYENNTKPITSLSSGNFFGEKALLNDNDVRAATCIATTDVKCIFLMREDFVRMLGNLKDLLDKSWKNTNEPSNELVDGISVEKQKIKSAKDDLNIKLEDLEIVRVLNSGAFSTVKLVKFRHKNSSINKVIDNQQNTTPQVFALKCLIPTTTTDNQNDENKSNISKLSILFTREKVIMNLLDGTSPFITRFYCEIRINNNRSDSTNNTNIFFLLEALLGGDLLDLLQNKSKFPEDWSMFYSASVLCAFSEIHSRRIAYRDLKPENLVLDTTGYVKVIDFGLATRIEAGKSWTLCGTLDYLSPEIILNEGHDWAVDYWALGVFIFEITAGFSPFTLDDQFEMYRKILSGKIDIPLDFSSNLANLVKALLRKDPSKRLGKTKGGTSSVKEHKWFTGFDWNNFFSKKLKAPHTPKIEHEFVSDAVNEYANESRDSDIKRDFSSSNIAQNHHSSLEPNEIINKPIEYKKFVLETDKSVKQHTFASETNKKYINNLDALDENASISSFGNDDILQNDFKGENHKSKPKSNNFEKNPQNEKTHLNELQRSDKALPCPETDESNRSIEAIVHRTISDSDSKSISINNKSPLVSNSGSFEVADNTVNLTGGSDDICSDGMKEDEIATKILVKYTRRLSCVKKGSFNHFALFSITSETLTPNILSGGNGSKCFDPFVVKTSQQIDHFPQINNIDSFTSDGISSLCFPNGIEVRFIPKCTLDNAYKIGWIGKKADRYQLHVFTNVDGTRTYGISITVKYILEMSSHLSTQHQLLKLKRKAVAIISNWWEKIKRKVQSLSRFKDSTPMRKKSFIAFNTIISMGKQQVNNEGAYPREKDFFRFMHPNKSFSNTRQTNSMSTKRKAMISYRNMILNDKKDDLCIVEKCYAINGIRYDEQSLLFNALQSLVDSERENDCAASRHLALGEIQRLQLSFEQSLIEYPENQRTRVEENRSHYVHQFSSEGLASISLPLPLPQLCAEWGVAMLILRMKMSSLLILLKLLLLERSILVIGESYEDVTSCTCTLSELLKPFQWCSVFIPILPGCILDFVSSPVPFIAGVVANTKEKVNKIINDARVENAMSSGLSVLNITSGKLDITEEDGIKDIVSECFSTIHLLDDANKLNLLKERLQELVNNKNNSSLLSFKSFFENGASSKESLTVSSIRKEICASLSSLPSAISKSRVPNGWNQFGLYDEDTKDFEFHPEYYIESVRYQSQFEEKLAQTQLFISFLDEQRKHDVIEQDSVKMKSGAIITKWLCPTWRKHRKRVASYVLV